MRIYIIIGIFIILTLIINYSYENYINEPYITVKAEAGLNNRIQVLLSYLYRANREGKKLKIVWILDEQCPDRFDTLFNPINNVTILYNEIDNNNYDYRNWDKENTDYIKQNYYDLLKPINSIQLEIDNLKNKLQDYIAVHIRRTDATTHQWYSHHIKSDEEYINFINSYPSNMKIYIATDCRITQETFINLYRDRIVYKKIEPTNELRQTSLQDAVKDMYVCAGAKYFMRSHGSFSDTIEYLRNLKVEKFHIDGDEIYEEVLEIKNSENSRFNYKTKECSHWYSKEIVNEILSANKNKKVLILGVALGGQIVHLLNKDPYMYVTGVDILDNNFHIVEKYSDKKRLKLIKQDAYEYIMNSNEIYDVIVCDIFIGMNIADFVLNNKFLNKINKMFTGKFILNTTINSDKNMVVDLLNTTIPNSSIQIKHNPTFINNLYFVTKN